MKERPILFSGPMIRAILEGRKTQTRRLHKKRRTDNIDDPSGPLWSLPSPYGSPGDALWVREAIVCTSINKRPPPYDDDVATASYAADGAPCPCDRWPWQRYQLPGIHMPYGLRRITLDVSDVRVQRLQDISGDDAAAEGIAVPRCGCEVCSRSSIMCPADASAHIEEFAALWDSINGKRAPWSSNPWVWAITFRRVP